MARTVVQGEGGFTYNKTDVAGHLVLRKGECPDSLAFLDIDGDGMIDFIGIESQRGNREDDDHELVAVHGGTGNILWRTLNGEVSDTLSICDGVLLCATDDRTKLRGLDPRTGQQLWAITPPDKIKDDPFDTDVARSITPRGPFALFECKDDTLHVVEARTGRVVYWRPGQLIGIGLELPGLIAIEYEDQNGDNRFDLYDLFRGRVVYSDKKILEPVFCQGPGVLAVVHGAYRPSGGVGNKIVLLDPMSYDVRGQAWLSWYDNDGDEVLLPTGNPFHQRRMGVVLPGNRILVGDREEGRLFVFSMQGGQVGQVIPPPQPGYDFRCLAVASNVLVAAYIKKEGSKRMILVGYDLGTLQGRWWIPEGLGGPYLHNNLLTNWTTVLAPSARRDDRDYKPNNPVAWWHIDPTTGQKVTEYPVPELDCVELDGKWLCGFVSTYYHGHPWAYDLEKRERVL